MVRAGPATFDPDCEEDSFDPDGEAHCWLEQRVIDVFDAEGRYLGEVSLPPNFSLEPLPFIGGNDVIARVTFGARVLITRPNDRSSRGGVSIPFDSYCRKRWG